MSNGSVDIEGTVVSAREVGYWFRLMPLTKAHWLAGLALFGSFVIESWEMMIVIYSSGAIAAELGLTGPEVGSLMSAIFIGMIPGALIWGKLSGMYGRKRCLMISLGSYCLFPLLSATAPNFETLWLVRFLGGVVLSGALVVTFPFMLELVPVRSRGRATVWLSSGWPLGVLVAIAVTASFSGDGWRLPVGFSSVVGLWAIVIYKLVPESPYWLAEKGRTLEANRAVRRLSGGATQAETLSGGATTADTGKFIEIFRHPLLYRTTIQTIINFCFAWGFWSFTAWMPGLLAERGLRTPEGLGFIAISAVFMFPGYVAASFLTGRYGRKKVMLSFLCLAALAGFGFAYSQSLPEMYIWNFTLSFFSLGAWGVWNTWLGEIYDTGARGVGVGWGFSMQRIGNSIAPIVTGAILASGTFSQTVVVTSSFLAVTFVAATMLPETEGKVLH